MSGSDTKTPAVTPDAGALLESLVEEHLERAGGGVAPSADPVAVAAGGAALPEPALDAADSAQAMADAIQAALAGEGLVRESVPETVPAAEPSVAQAFAAGESVGAAAGPLDDDLLKREIETLLRGSDSPAAENVEGDGEVAFSDAAAMVQEQEGDVTQAEMAALLPAEEAGVVGIARLPAAEGGAVGMADQQVAAAEDLLAAELAQLMGEAQASMDAGKAEQAKEVVPEAPVAEAVPVVDSEAMPEKSPEDLSASIAQIMAGAAIHEPQEKAATVEGAKEEVSDHLDGEISDGPEAAVEKVPRGPGVVGRVWGGVKSVLLVVAQILDLPFAMVGEADKNVIGVVAAVLFLSGCLLWAMSLWWG